MALLTGRPPGLLPWQRADSFPDRHAQCRGFWSTLLWRVSPNGRSSAQVHRFIHFWGGRGEEGKNAGTRMCRAVAWLRCRVFLKMGVSFLRGCGLTALADGYYYVSAAWRRKYSRRKMVCHRGKRKEEVCQVVRRCSWSERFSKGVHKNRGDTSIEQDRGKATNGRDAEGRPAGRRRTDGQEGKFVSCVTHIFLSSRAGQVQQRE